MRKIAKVLLMLLCWQPAWAGEFEEKLIDLNASSFPAKVKAIEAMVEISDERILPTLKAMQDGDLYVLADGSVVIAKKAEDGYQAQDVLSGQNIGLVSKRDVDKIRINNRVRRALTSAVAVLELNSEQEPLRFQSAKNLQKKPEPELRDFLLRRLEKESSKRVLATVEVVLALIDIHSDNSALRQAALEVLGGSVESEAVVAVRQLVQKDEQGEYLEADLALVKSAEAKLKHIEARLKTLEFTKNLMFGVSLGAVLLLAAIGLAITFGVMGVINMAHGEMIMLGAYTTFAIQQLFPNLIEASLFIAIPAAFLVSGMAGILIERTVIRHLYGRPLDTLLATFGISLILQQAVRMYSSNNVPVITPSWLSGSLDFNGALSLTYNRIYIIVFSLIVLAMLALLLKKTLVGLQMRAVTQNRPMANSMGIRSGWVDALTFGLGSGIAGIAGVALSQLTNVGPNLGQGYIIDSFMVVVFGGVGNLLGTFFAAISLGIVNKFLEPYAGAVLGKIIVLVFIILFIQWRPRGLFALKGRFVED